MEINSIEGKAHQIQIGGRILDIPCKVCGDYSSGKHYNIYTCDGCAGFFKRSIRKQRQYICKDQGLCVIDKNRRNQCRSCRLKKCEEVGMNKEAVQHERGPRTTTIRRLFESNQLNMLSTSSSSSSPPPPLPPPTSLSSVIHQRHHHHNSQYQQQHHHRSAAAAAAALIQSVTSNRTPTTTTITNPTTINLATTNMNVPLLSHQIPFLLNHLNESTVSPAARLFFPPLQILPPHHLQHQQFLFSESLSTPKSICERAAALIFTVILYIKNTSETFHLPYEDQLILLEETWREIYILYASQYLPINFDLLIENNNDDDDFIQNVRLLERTLKKLKDFSIDDFEYYYLRILTFFNIHLNENLLTKLKSFKLIALHYDFFKDRLLSYETFTKHDPKRTTEFLYLLYNFVYKIPKNLIVDLFFKQTIGDTPINAIIKNMYKEDSVTIKQKLFMSINPIHFNNYDSLKSMMDY